ncbi:MAG: hypothetical protein HC923_06770 [Myxococcales bacterium]|nr:hypothetical protein [Myxococcales bacterium]
MSSVKRFLSLAVAASPLLLACGDDELPPTIDVVPGTLEIGSVGPSGELVALDDGGDVMLEAGSQGGFHIALQFRIDQEARNALGAFTFHERSARRVVDNRLVSTSDFEVAWVATPVRITTSSTRPSSCSCARLLQTARSRTKRSRSR